MDVRGVVVFRRAGRGLSGLADEIGGEIGWGRRDIVAFSRARQARTRLRLEGRSRREMMLQEQVEPEAAAPERPWPPEVGVILSALEAGEHGQEERRKIQRGHYRVQADLRLFSDPPGTSAWTLYTRDASPRGMGFITPHQLPLGHGGMVEFTDPFGNEISVNCTLYRCRLAAPGWFEGALYFNRDQWVFQELIEQQAAGRLRLTTDNSPGRG
jgi:hypothetical protein